MKTFALVLILSMNSPVLDLEKGIVNVEATLTMEVGKFNSLEECLADKAIKEPDLKNIDDPEVKVKSFDCIEK